MLRFSILLLTIGIIIIKVYHQYIINSKSTQLVFVRYVHSMTTIFNNLFYFDSFITYFCKYIQHAVF